MHYARIAAVGWAAAIIIGWVPANAQERRFQAEEYGVKSDQQPDDESFRRCFEAVQEAGGGVVVIPPGEYHLVGLKPIALPSQTTVFAHGARFLLPESLGNQQQRTAFEGVDLQDFSWFGGKFEGRCFDHRREKNDWEPHANTRVFSIRTTVGGSTRRLTFRDVTADRVAGSVVGVEGDVKAVRESEVKGYAEDVTVENCTFRECGKFMWDYGLLWQITVWPEDYTEPDRAVARRYFRNDLIASNLTLADGADRISLDNHASPLPLCAADRPSRGVCFFGDGLPKNVVRGKIYYVVESKPDFIRISDGINGPPMTFDGSAGANVRMIRDVHATFMALYQPTGAGPGKGGLDLVGCRGVTVRGCKLSALGDTMHIQRSRDIVFSGNQITGSRMGAFFLAEYCKNAVVTGNIVDGGNGSRVMSIEKSCEDVTVVGNTFRNGGRGSWINQPKNLVMQGNVFLNNTTKGEQDPWRGRRTWKTGGWEQHAELYFTLHQPDGRYGPVVMKDNIFQTGPDAAVVLHLERNGDDVLIDGNIFRGPVTKAWVDPRTKPTFGVNLNVVVEPAPEGVRFGNP